MRQVYILGAGASAGYRNGELGRPPVARIFFKAVSKVLATDAGNDWNRFSDLWSFLRKYYRVSRAGLRNCNLDIEEVLTVLDVSMCQVKASRQLRDLIAITLDKIIYGEPCRHHKRLLESLNADDTIITFNWDLLLDNLVALDHGGCPNYGVPMLEIIPEPPYRNGDYCGNPLVLKPHGSLNWMTCWNCRKSFAHILRGKTGAEYHAGKPVNCHYCKEPTVPVMIPPTLMKNYRHPVIEAVWREAARVLREAEKIVVVGYSLPATDFMAKWLFMKASANRTVRLESLTIVDKNPAPLKEKFRRVFHASNAVTKIVKGGINDMPV